MAKITISKMKKTSDKLEKGICNFYHKGLIKFRE